MISEKKSRAYHYKEISDLVYSKHELNTASIKNVNCSTTEEADLF